MYQFFSNTETKWPASRKKRHSDITHSVDQDQPPKRIFKIPIRNHTERNISAIEVTSVKSADPDQTRRRRRGGDFLHMSEGPFSHGAGHISI